MSHSVPIVYPLPRIAYHVVDSVPILRGEGINRCEVQIPVLCFVLLRKSTLENVRSVLSFRGQFVTPGVGSGEGVFRGQKPVPRPLACATSAG